MTQKRVLLVEDEPGVRMTLAGNLELEGFDVVEAASAEEALRLLQGDQDIDLVLSDIRMPGMGGVSLLRRVRKSHPDLPVVLMTAFTAEENIEEAIGAGVFTVLAKPFEFDHAAQLLTKAMARPVVLVIDTEANGTALLDRELTAAGLRTARAESAQAALDVVANGGADVCVAAVARDSQGTLALIEAIRAEHREVSVIVATGSESSEFLSRVALLGARTLRHPRDSGRLLRAVSELRAEGTHA